MDIEVRVPSEFERADWLALYELFFEVGLCLPIPNLARKILLNFNLAPTQLMPKAWRIIICYVMLGEEVGRQLTLGEFLTYYVLKVNSQGRAQHYISPRGSIKLVTELDYTDRLWKNYYFILRLSVGFSFVCYVWHPR